MIISSAPGRCGVIGNPTDMYGGSVISCTTAERATCTLAESDELVLCVSDSEIVVRDAADLELARDRFDVARAVLRYFDLVPGDFAVRLTAASDIPECAGLGGSTAMVVAILGAVTAYLDIEMDPYAMAETARRIERRGMRVVCGFQDHYMTVFGGLNYMDFRGKERLAQDDDEPLATVEPLQGVVPEVPLVVAHTGIAHHSGTVHKSIRERWEERDPVVTAAYERIARLARLGKKALIARDWPALGRLMNENHEIQRELGGSGEQNDRLIGVARASGAFGAKLAGAGNGGTIVALSLEPERVRRALLEAGAESIHYPRPSEGLSVEPSWERQVVQSVGRT